MPPDPPSQTPNPHPPAPPLEACAFGAHLGNRSVFKLDPRLKGCLPFYFSNWVVSHSHGQIWR